MAARASLTTTGRSGAPTLTPLQRTGEQSDRTVSAGIYAVLFLSGAGPAQVSSRHSPCLSDCSPVRPRSRAARLVHQTVPFRNGVTGLIARSCHTHARALAFAHARTNEHIPLPSARTAHARTHTHTHTHVSVVWWVSVQARLVITFCFVLAECSARSDRCDTSSQQHLAQHLNSLWSHTKHPHACVNAVELVTELCPLHPAVTQGRHELPWPAAPLRCCHHHHLSHWCSLPS